MVNTLPSVLLSSCPGQLRNIHRKLDRIDGLNDQSHRHLDVVESANGQVKSYFQPSVKESKYTGMKSDKAAKAPNQKQKSRTRRTRPPRKPHRSKLVTEKQHETKSSLMRRVSQTLDDLDEQASALDQELQCQNGMLDEISEKMINTDKQFSQLNKKMRSGSKRKRHG